MTESSARERVAEPTGDGHRNTDKDPDKDTDANKTKPGAASSDLGRGM